MTDYPLGVSGVIDEFVVVLYNQDAPDVDTDEQAFDDHCSAIRDDVAMGLEAIVRSIREKHGARIRAFSDGDEVLPL